MNILNKFIIVMIVIFIAGCAPDKKTLAETSAPSPPAEDNFQEIDSPLYVQLASRWEMDKDGSYSVNSTCEVPKLAPIRTVKNCIFTVPEEKLYYSNLKYAIGTSMAAACPIIHFSPYYYRRSNSATFRPAGQDADVDCSGATGDNRLCYGGAAPSMISDFPKTRGRYFNTNLLAQSTFDLPSENTTRWYGGVSVNYLATNNISNPASVQPGSGADARTGTKWVDYTVWCADIWGEMQFQINFILQDENWDPAGTGADQYTDWP